MKKIILTLLLTLSALVNVNAVAAFSLDVDGNGTINASNDGLVIFKYLLNSNANNLHTTISSNAADDRKTTAQLKAYLDGAGTILDVDGNGTTNASNDGLVIFKYLLNSNANNLHTTISSNAPDDKKTTINLKAYLDRYINISSGAITNGTATAAGGFSEYYINGAGATYYNNVRDVNNDNDILDSGTYIEHFITELIDGVEVDTSKRVSVEIIYTVTLPNNINRKRIIESYSQSGGSVDTTGGVTTSVGDDTDGDFGRVVSFVANSTLSTIRFYTKDYAGSSTTWDGMDLAGFIALYDEVIAKVLEYRSYTTYGTAAGTVTATFSESNVGDKNGDGDTSDSGTTVEIFNITYIRGEAVKSVATGTFIYTVTNDVDSTAAAEELVAIFALGTPPTALADYSALDAEADGISGQTERAQHIVNSLTNLDEVTVTYISNTSPKSFNVAKSGETTINVLQDSSSGSAVSLDTLSVFKDIYFQTIQAKWDILHPNYLTPAETKAANEKRITDLMGSYGVTSISINDASGDLFVAYTQDGNTTNFVFGVFADFGVIPQSTFNNKFAEFKAKLIADQVTVTAAEELAAIFADGNNRPDDINDYPVNVAEINSFPTSGNNAATAWIAHVETYLSANSVVVVHTNGRWEVTLGSDTVNVTYASLLSGRLATFLELLQTKWDLLYPAVTAFEQEIIDIYAADTPPTGFISGGAIETEALAFQSPLTSAIQTFMQKLNSENYEVFSLGATAPVKVSLKTGQQIFSPYDDITVGSHTGEQIRDWALEVVKAIWLLEHPNYVASDPVNAALATFYAATTAPAAVSTGGASDYGQQLPSAIEDAATAAFDSDDDDTIEAFLKKLSNGATHLGLDSYLEWFPSPTHYIVTNNGGEGNGFYDIPITGNLYLGAGTWDLNDLGKSNLKHLAYHIIWNFYTLANQSEATLTGFRQGRLESYAQAVHNHDWGWVRAETTHQGNATAWYYARYNSVGSPVTGWPNNNIVAQNQNGAYDLGDLTATNWVDFLDKWKLNIDNAN